MNYSTDGKSSSLLTLQKPKVIYWWRGINKHGLMSEGFIVINGSENAQEKLSFLHVKLLSKKRISFFSSKKPISKEDIYQFNQQLHALLKANLSIKEALQTIQNGMMKHPQFWLMLEQIILAVNHGETLSHALQNKTRYFSTTYCGLIRAGEETNNLVGTLALYLEQQSKMNAFTSKVKQSLYYPLFTLTMTLFVVLGLSHFIIPKFLMLYRDTTEQLPWLTQLIVNISHNINQISLYFIVLVLLLYFIIYFIHRHSSGKLFLDMALFKLPFSSYFIKKNSMITISHLLSLTLRSNMPILPALELTIAAISNHYIKQLLWQVHQHIQQGSTLYSTLSATTLFNLSTLQLIHIGEKNGLLNDMLYTIYQQERLLLEQTIIKLSNIIEPLLILLLGVIVTFVILGLYLPIFQLGNYL